MIWGAYGANAVHMSMLHEFIANATERSVGVYTQISDSYHAYHDVYSALLDKIPPVDVWNFQHVYSDPYKLASIEPYPQLLLRDHDKWLEVNSIFLQHVFSYPFAPKEIVYWSNSLDPRGLDPFFHNVAEPIATAWEYYKLYKASGNRENIAMAIEKLNQGCMARDWQRACVEWLKRKGI
tara:strand:+ start:275 stop:814 length:540 start_codon:yes stop_codon:yes gene_type:complete